MCEGYDLSLGRLMTSGVDIWLNTPIYPLEASGTSGMKAAMNGTVNLSVLDGWWAEAYDGRRGSKNGWAIPPPRDEQSHDDRDRQDSTTLYEILQDEVLPLYYARDERLGYSPNWVQLCKRSMASVLPAFNSERVLRDYLRDFYAPAARQGRAMAVDGYQAARELGAWKEKVRAAWPGVGLKLISTSAADISFAERVTLEVDVTLNGLAPRDVRVECQLRHVLGSELTVPAQVMRRTAGTRTASAISKGEPCSSSASRRARPTARASAAIGSSSSRPGLAPRSTRCEPCPTTRTCRTRTNSG